MVLATLLPATPRWVFVALPLHLRWGAAKAAGMTHLHHLIDSCLPTLFTALTWLDTALCVALLTVNPRPCTLLPALAWLDTALCVALPAGTPGNVLRQPHSFPMLLDLLRIAPVGVACGCTVCVRSLLVGLAFLVARASRQSDWLVHCGVWVGRRDRVCCMRGGMLCALLVWAHGVLCARGSAV
eukprot:1147572-Pelagomonas_calceolata.AAC.3